MNADLRKEREAASFKPELLTNFLDGGAEQTQRRKKIDSFLSCPVSCMGIFKGGFAAAVTTPLDVAKTRIMLAKTGSRTASGNVLSALRDVWRTQGIAGLFSGILPRISSISLGGFIFLGMYDKIRSLLL